MIVRDFTMNNKNMIEWKFVGNKLRSQNLKYAMNYSQEHLDSYQINNSWFMSERIKKLNIS